ncbi:MAG: TadE/TadG family type IV pilus assembly protein [Pseudomonadota bacterium]
MNTVHIRRREHSKCWQQSGVYAIEFALVFPVFFLLAYGVLAFALVFFMRLNLQHATEEGARAALQYQTTQSARLQRAVTVTQSQTSWMPVLPVVVADICPINSGCQPTSTPGAPAIACGDTMSEACQIVVVANYDYAANPLIPELLGLGLLLPNTLRAVAAVLVDGRTLKP